jgi:hypothetical protein
MGDLHVGDIKVPVFRPKPKIRHTVKVQDGHSTGEQALYQALWNAATPEGPDSRLICAGYGGMQELCGLDKTNCKDNIRTLIEKLAIEIAVGFSMQRNQGNTYRIFSYTAILRRRKAAGMEWVIRNRGVRFVAPPVSDSPIGDYDLPIGEEPNGPVGEAPITPLGETPTAIRNRNFEESESSSTRFAQAIRDFVGSTDDDAIRLLVENCRLYAPDATEAEILEIIRQKGFQLSRMRGITNPMGWLLEAVPKCFEGESFRRYRAERAILLHSQPGQESGDRGFSLAAAPQGSDEQPEMNAQILHLAHRLSGEKPEPWLFRSMMEAARHDQLALLGILTEMTEYRHQYSLASAEELVELIRSLWSTKYE